MKNTILVIDPFLKEPAEFALSTLSRLLRVVHIENKISSSHIEFFFTLSGKKSLRTFLNNSELYNDLIGVISLGSYANITDDLEWVNELGLDLKELIIEKSIPFLGICFSHQLMAHIYNLKIDFVEERDTLPNKKYNEFREITINHPRLKSIFTNNTFISMAKHEQEVKNCFSHLEITCSSKNCSIEGLVHKEYPAFSFQSHPEEFHESEDGWKLLKSFLLFFHTYHNI
jgi:GMP synthase-like glutamine amidotransferase